MTTIKLTPRERQVALKLVDGNFVKDIANEMSLSPKTVHAFANAIQKKLGMNTRQIILNREKILGVLA